MTERRCPTCQRPVTSGKKFCDHDCYSIFISEDENETERYCANPSCRKLLIRKIYPNTGKVEALSEFLKRTHCGLKCLNNDPKTTEARSRSHIIPHSPIEPRYCASPNCDALLVRKRYSSGNFEGWKVFLQRRYCDRECITNDPAFRERCAKGGVACQLLHRGKLPIINGGSHHTPAGNLKISGIMKARWDAGLVIPPRHVQKSRLEGRPYNGFSDEIVRSILSDQRKMTEIALAYGTSKRTILRIKHRRIKQYAHIEGEVFIGRPRIKRQITNV
jgi:hypothetical protein